MSFAAFSQSAGLNKNGDTVICFSIKQSKFLLKKYYEAEKCSILDSICEKQLSFSNNAIKSSEVVIQKQSLLAKNKEEELDIRKYEIENLNNSLSISQKEVRKQKVFKWIAIGTGAFTTSFLTYKYIKK